MLTNIVFIAKTQYEFNHILKRISQAVEPRAQILSHEYPVMFVTCPNNYVRGMINNLNSPQGKATSLDKTHNLVPCRVDEVYSVLVPVEEYFTLGQNLLSQGVVLEPDVELMP